MNNKDTSQEGTNKYILSTESTPTKIDIYQ